MKILVDTNTKLNEFGRMVREDICEAIKQDSACEFVPSSVAKKSFFGGRSRLSLVRRMVKLTKPDVFIGFSTKYSNLRMSGLKYFVLVSRNEITQKLAKKIDKFDKAVVFTNYQKLRLSNNFGLEKSKILVFSPTISSEFKYSDITQDERDIRRILTIYRITKPYLFFYSKLDTNSNVENLISAFAQIDEKFPEYKLLLASPDFSVGWDNKAKAKTKEAQQILDLIIEQKLQRKVVFAGKIEMNHLPVVIQNADICITLRDYKHFPKALIEQLVCGACIMVSDNPVAKEIIANSGKIVSAKSMLSIRAGLTQLIEDTKLRQHFSSKAKKRGQVFLPKNVYSGFIDNLRQNFENKPKERAYLLRLDKFDVVDTQKVFENFFDLKILDKPRNLSIIGLLRRFQKTNKLFVEGGWNLVDIFRFGLIKLLRRDLQIWAVEPGFPINKRLRGYFYGKFLKLIVERFMIFGSIRKIHSSSQVLLPFYVDVDFSGISKELKQKLKGYVGVYILGDNTSISKIIEKTIKGSKYYFLSEDIDDITVSTRYAKRIAEAGYLEGIATAKIVVDLDSRLDEHKILEAFAAGCVVILPKSSRYASIINEGINGYLFKSGELDNIASILDKFVENKKHLEDIRRVNTQNASSLAFDSIQEIYNQIFREL